MTEQAEQLSYFQAMKGCFGGTRVFERLIRQGMGRTLRHVFLTLFLLGVVVTALLLPGYFAAIDETAAHFEAIFGGIVWHEDTASLVPAKNPAETRYFLPGGGGIVLYAPEGITPELPEKTAFRDYRMAVIWHPRDYIVVFPAGDDEFAVGVFLFRKMMPEVQTLCRESELEQVLAKASATGKDHADEPDDGGDPAKAISTDTLCRAVKFWACGFCFAGFFAEGMGQVAVFVLIFVGLFALVNRNEKHLRYGELVRIALYASCPVLAVAACFPALQLTGYLHFGTVYIVGAIIYFLVIVNNLERTRGNGRP